MARDDGNPGDVIIPMPEEKRTPFIPEQLQELRSTMLGIKNNPAVRRGSETQRVAPKIQRVPPNLWHWKEEFAKYFEPRMFALGPLHHGNPRLRRGEQTKLILTSLFLLKNNMSEDSGFRRIMREIDDLKKCYYQEDIQGFDDSTLAWMLFVDGCAVLYGIYCINRRVELPLDLNIQGDVMVLVNFDTWLLENQLPYRVLKTLIELSSDPQLLVNSTLRCIHETAKPPSGLVYSCWFDEDSRARKYAHLLEQLRTQLLAGEEGIQKSDMSRMGLLLLRFGALAEDMKSVNSVMDLKDSGIQVRPSQTKNLKDISFHCKLPGILKVPALVMREERASMFMNLIALESIPDFINDSGVKNYICFIATLIQTPQDVKELRVRGVLHNYLGSDEEVVNLFRRMSRDLMLDRVKYDDIFKNIRSCCNLWFIRMYSDYFGANWSLIAFLAAIIGLVLTLLQTCYTINPKPNIERG